MNDARRVRDERSLSCCRRGAYRRVPGGAGGIRTPDIRLAKAALSQLSYGPADSDDHMMVGHPGFEPGTSVLSGLRSNQLS